MIHIWFILQESTNNYSIFAQVFEDFPRFVWNGLMIPTIDRKSQSITFPFAFYFRDKW